MPLKTWAPYDRLTAADLNANFLYAVGHPVPGAFAAYNPTPTNITPIDTWIETKCITPTAGSDPLGFWNPTSSRLVVPAGYGGVYLLAAYANFSGGAAGNQRSVRVNPTTFTQAAVASQVGGANNHIVAIGSVPAGGQIFMECMARVDTCTAQAVGLVAVRLGIAWGAPTALLGELLEAALGGPPLQNELPEGLSLEDALAQVAQGGAPPEP
jgi:hypothetical protein